MPTCLLIPKKINYIILLHNQNLYSSTQPKVRYFEKTFNSDVLSIQSQWCPKQHCVDKIYFIYFNISLFIPHAYRFGITCH